MTRKLATIAGLAYAALGVAGLFNTAIIGQGGFIAADASYSYAFIAIAVMLLFAALMRRESARRTTLAVGALLAVVALSGFLIAPESGQMFGMLVNNAGHYLNLVVGLSLAGVALLERAPQRTSQSLRDIGYMRQGRTMGHA